MEMKRMIHLLPEYINDAPEDERNLTLCGVPMSGRVASARFAWLFHAARQDVCPECLDVVSKESEGIIPPSEVFYRMREKSGKSLCQHEHKTPKGARGCEVDQAPWGAGCHRARRRRQEPAHELSL